MKNVYIIQRVPQGIIQLSLAPTLLHKGAWASGHMHAGSTWKNTRELEIHMPLPYNYLALIYTPCMLLILERQTIFYVYKNLLRCSP